MPCKGDSNIMHNIKARINVRIIWETAAAIWKKSFRWFKNILLLSYPIEEI